MKAIFMLVVILLTERSTLTSGAEVSVVVDSTCDYNSPSSTVIVTHSPVTLTCCVKRCILWTGYWYRRTDNGTNQLLSTGPSLSVNVTETEEMFVCVMLSDDDPACYDDPRGQGNVTLVTSSGTNVSIVVNSSCSSGPSQDTFIVTHIPVTLTCCVKGSCPNWTVHWYKESDINQSLSMEPSISVNLTETLEIFICVVSLSPQVDNPFCHDNQHYQDSIKLIKCLLPQVSPVNHTTDIVPDNSHIIVYFKVHTEEYIISSPTVKFNDSTTVTRWHMKYYAETDDGGIGKEIQYISKAFHFFISLETKHQFSYDYDNGRYVIEVENKCGTSTSYVDIKGDCDDSIPAAFIERPQTKLFALVGQDVLLHLKYKGIRIATYWMVNGTSHLNDVPYILNTRHHFNKPSVCEEIYNLKLLQVTHSYNGNFTAYGCRGDFTDSAPNLTVNLKVCNKPEFYKAQSYVKYNATTAILQFTFTVCYDPNDELVELHWLKNNRTVSDVRYNTHSESDKSLYVFTLIIHNISVNDTGNYTCKLWYNKAMINASTLKEGTLHLNIPSQTTDSKSVHDTTWLLIAGLVGGVVALLLGILVVTGRKLHSKIQGNGYVNLNTATFAPNNDDAYVVANCDDSDEGDIEPSEGPREPNANNNDNEGFGAGINGDINRSSDISNESSRSSSHRGEVENSANSHDLRGDARLRCLVQ